MKKYVLTIFYLLMLATGISAQNKPDTQSLPQCKENLAATQRQLKNEQSAHKATLESKNKLETELQNLQHKYKMMEEELNLTKKQVTEVEPSSEFEKTISEIRSTHPIIIKKIELRSLDKSESKYSRYGDDLDASKTKLLCLKIHYISLLNEPEEIQFDIILYHPGKKLLFKKTLSPKPPDIYKENKTIKSGNGTVEFTCIQGQHDSFTYPPGKYSIEIRYKDVFLGKKEFEIKED